MAGPLGTSLNTTIRAPGGRQIVEIPFRATTNGSNVMTIATTFDATLTVTNSGNQYTFVVGPYKALICAVVNSSLAAAPNGAIGAFSETGGTIRVDFTGAQTNAQINGVFYVEV
jgi:hypothetical protein